MRASILTLSLLLATPLLIAPAQGVEVSEAFCEGPLCLRAQTAGGNVAADASVEGAGDGSANACLRDVDCVAAHACLAAEGSDACLDARNCTAYDPDQDPRCTLITPCRDLAEASTRDSDAPALPVDCIPQPRPLLGWNACRGAAKEFTLRVFTGLGVNGQGSAAGTVDGLWRTVAYPPVDWAAPTLSGPAYSRGVHPVSSYVSSTASSWINPYANTNDGPGGQYVFEAKYFIPANAWGVTLSGRYAVDNNALVSDSDSSVSQLLSTSALDAFGFWTPLPTTSLATGIHTLTVNLNNRHAPSPVGANVQATVHGYCQPVVGVDACTGGARSFRIVLNTGIDLLGNPLPDGALDPRWTKNGVTPAESLGQDPLPGTWVTDPASSWIGDIAETELPDDTLLRPIYAAAGDVFYAYEIAYHLPANAYNVQVNGKAAADNKGVLSDTDAFLSTYVATTPDPYGFTTWTPFSYAVTTNGLHVFGASVVNHEGPTGLNVVAEVTGLCGKIITTGEDWIDEALP